MCSFPNVSPELASAKDRDLQKLQADYSQEDTSEITKSLKVAVTKSQKAYDSQLIGIVSTNPGVLLGDITGFELESNLKPVALSGRVSVKVTDENGPIRAGDLLVSAPTAGSAMRYDPSGDNLIEAPTTTFAIIGVALEDFNPSPALPSSGEGKILVFVNLEHQKLTAASTDLGNYIALIESTSNPGMSALKFNAEAIFAHRLAAENGQWSLDEQGLLIAKEIHTEKLKIIGNKTVGRARIISGDTAITINTTAVTATSKIFASFLTDTAGRTWYISEKTEGEHFTLKLSGGIPFDVDFDWWIVDTDDNGSEMQYSSGGTPSQASEPATPSSSPPIQGTGGEGETAGSATTTSPPAEPVTSEPAPEPAPAEEPAPEPAPAALE